MSMRKDKHRDDGREAAVVAAGEASGLPTAGTGPAQASIPLIDKRLARLNLMRDILSRLQYAGKKNKFVQPDPDVAFELTPDCIAGKRLARC